MKHYLLFIAPLLSATSMVAQPVIDLVDAPVPDQHFNYLSAAFMPVTATGEDVIWDLSAMVGTDQPVITTVDPEATAYGSTFPTATVALDDGSNLIFLRADPTGLYTVGNRIPVSTINIVVSFTDDQMMLPFPCTYNTAFTDSFAYNYSFTAQGGQLQTVQGGGNTGYTADGYGTLVLPYDTVQNVLKLTGVDSVYESIPGTTYLTVSNTVYFYKPGIHYFLLKATEAVRFQNGVQTQTGQGISYLSEDAFAGIHEDAAKAIGIEAWPVPARNVLNVSYGLSGGRQVDVALFDVTGRNVRSITQRTGTAGIQVATLNVEDLPAGIYMLTVTDDRGQRGTRQVVIE